MRKTGSNLHAYNGSRFLFIGPIPEGDRLVFSFSSNSDYVLVVFAQVHAANTVRVRIQESPHWNSAVTIPNYEHRVIPSVGRYYPPFVVAASCCCDLIAVTLQQLLGLLHMVVNNASVGGGVEDLGTTVSCQIVNTLVNVFVEADDPLQVLKGIN